MKISAHHKLVRNRIPEIIDAAGKVCATSTLSNEEKAEIERICDEKLVEYYASW